MPKVNVPIRLPFFLYDSTGAAQVDTVAGNYGLGVCKDGVLMAPQPTLTVTRPDAGSSGLLLAFTPTQAGVYTWSQLTHSTYTPDLKEGMIVVTTYSVDDAMAVASNAVPQAAQSILSGNSIEMVVRQDNQWVFTLSDGAGGIRNIDGVSFAFRCGDRTAASDTDFYSATATGVGTTVTFTISQTNAGNANWTSRIDKDVWYELEEIDSGPLHYAKAIARIRVVRNIP